VFNIYALKPSLTKNKIYALTLAHSKRNWRRFYFVDFIQFAVELLFYCVVMGLVGHSCKPQPSDIIIIIIIIDRDADRREGAHLPW